MIDKRLFKKRMSIFILVFTLLLQTLTPIVALAVEETEDVINITNVERQGDEIVIEGTATGNPDSQLMLILDGDSEPVEVLEDGSFYFKKSVEILQLTNNVQLSFGEALLDLTEQVKLLIGEINDDENGIIEEPIEDPIVEEPIENEEVPEENPGEVPEENPEELPGENPETEPIEEKPDEEIKEPADEVKNPAEEALEGKDADEVNPEEIQEHDEQFIENPDNLPGPIEIEGSAIVDLSGNSTSFVNRLESFATRQEILPGHVNLIKEVKEVEGLLNTFEVKLRIEALDAQKSNDIVLVLDTSGSMAGSRLTNTKAAAVQFVNQLLTESHPETRIALVTFASIAYKRINFVDYLGKDNLITTINGLSANGGTHTQAGVHAALEYLNDSTADMKQIVLLSDGEPTYSYAMYNPDSYLIEYPGYGGQTGTHSPKENYNYNTTIGTGNSLRYRYYNDWWDSEDKYYNNGNSAIAEAGFAKNDGITVHTIAMDAGQTGSDILNNMASPNKAYSTTDPAELGNIFATIAADIQSAMRDASVSDPMGTGFNVAGGYVTDLEPSQGTATYDQAAKRISWNIGNLTEPTPETDDNPNMKYAELIYHVEINDDILDAVGTDGLYNTNDGASVTYKNIDGEIITTQFPEPKAKPLIIEMKKVLLDAGGNVIPDEFSNNRIFNFHVKLDNPPQGETTYPKDYPTGGNRARVMTDIRIDDYYSLSENEISGSPLTQFSDYITTVNWETYDGSKSGTLQQSTDYNNFKVPRDESGEPLNTRFTFTNKEKALGRLEIYKVVNNMPTPTGRMAIRQASPTFKVQIIGTNIYDSTEEIYNEERDLTTNSPIILENLQYGEYTVTEIETNGFNPIYSDTEGDLTDGKVKITITDKTQTVTITNTPDVDNAYIDFVAKKVWSGGPEEDHVAVDLELYQDGNLYTTITPTVEPATGIANEFTYKWTGLPKYNMSGGEAVYTVAEKNQHPYYDVTQEGNIITNTYNTELAPFTVTGNKNWNGGSTPRPDIWFTLYRKVGTGDEELVTTDANGATITSTKHVMDNKASWDNMPRNDGNPANIYIYFVKETNATGEDFEPANYTKLENGLTVTNTYTSPLTEDLIGTKTWGNAPEVKPEVKLELWRRGGTAGGGEKVLDGIATNENSVNFGKQNLADTNGVEYTYYVKEVGEDGGIVTLNGLKYQVTYNGMTVDNSLIITNINVKANKVWVDGPPNKPTVGFRLFRNIEGGEVDAVSGATMYRLTGGATEATWENMPNMDDNGNTYTYSVKEYVAVEPFDPTNPEYSEMAPENYTKLEEGLQVTNTYLSPLADVTATKEWVGGGINKPTIHFKLFRKIAEENPEEVAEVKEVPNVTPMEVTWEDLPTTDKYGNEYIYFVKEVDADGNDFTPENYRKVEEGLKVTNYYESPSNGEITVTKIWEGDERVTRPEMRFTLYKTIDKDVEGSIATTETKIVNGEITEATWTGLVEYDENAVPYIYYVKEEFVEEGKVTNDNWILGDYDFDNNTITNKVVKNYDDDTPDEKIGKLDIKKVLINELQSKTTTGIKAASDPIKFKVKITDEYGIETIVEIMAGETINLTDLYYGEYIIEETVTHGYTPSYDPEKVTVIKDPETIPMFVVTNTNTGEDDTIVSKTIKKVWVNGPKPGATLELWRKGKTVDESIIDEKVGEFAATAVELSKEFQNLAKHDPSGREFEYYVKEDNVPENYTAIFDQENLTVTNTYKVPQTDENIVATKVWVEDLNKAEYPNYVRPSVKFELWRKGGTAGAGEKVVDATGLTDNKVDFGKQDKTDINGVVYEYYVKEIYNNPNDPLLENWSKKEEGLKVTNTVNEPEGKLTIKKVITPKSAETSRKFKVRITGPYGYEKVIEIASGKSVELKELYYGKYTVTEINPDGFEPQYSAREVILRKNNPKAEITITNKKIEDPTYPIWPIWPVDPTTPELNKRDHFGYVIGYPQGDFRPENTITRAEMTAIFARLLEEKIFLNKDYPIPFDDVSRNAWYAEYVGMLTQVGVISGYPDGSFRPENPVTRAEFATVASRFIASKKTVFGGFTDIASEYWAKESIQAAYAEGWLKGYPDGSFRPERELTRAEAVTIINRMLDRVADRDYVDINVKKIVNYTDLTKAHWAYYDIMEASNSHDYVRLNNRAERWTRHWRPY